MKWPSFRKSYPPNRWEVEVRGGPIDLPSISAKGFITVRVVIAESREEAVSMATAEVFSDLQVPVEEQERLIRSISAGRLEPHDKGRKPIFHVWTEEDDYSKEFDELEAELRGNNLWIVREPESLTVKAEESGQFDVRITLTDGELTVYADEWHGHFAEWDQARSCFRWLLTPFYRVRTESKDGAWVGSWIERFEAKGWNSMQPILAIDCVALMEQPGPFRVKTAQNNFLDPGDYERYVRGAKVGLDGLPAGSNLGTDVVEFDFSHVKRNGFAAQLGD